MEPRKDVENSFTRLDLSLAFVAPRHEKKKKRKRRDEINSILAWGGEVCGEASGQMELDCTLSVGG